MRAYYVEMNYRGVVSDKDTFEFKCDIDDDYNRLIDCRIKVGYKWHMSLDL